MGILSNKFVCLEGIAKNIKWLWIRDAQKASDFNAGLVGIEGAGAVTSIFGQLTLLEAGRECCEQQERIKRLVGSIQKIVLPVVKHLARSSDG